MNFKELTRDQKSLILYLETCMVDGLGKLESIKMNQEDWKNMEFLKKQELITYGLLTGIAIENAKKYGKQYTHWVRFSAKIWKIAHRLRKERSKRILKKEKERLDNERIIPVELEVGKEYIIDHCRKGTFCGKIIKDGGGDFVTVEVTKGRAEYLSMMNAGLGCVGDHISVRKGFCTFKEVE